MLAHWYKKFFRQLQSKVWWHHYLDNSIPVFLITKKTKNNVLCFCMLNNPPDNWHFTVDPPPPQKKKKKKGVFWAGRSEFWDKIVNFWFYDIKKILTRIWDRPDLPATFRPIFAFWNPKICKNWLFLRNFKVFLCSKLDFGQKLFQIHDRWFSRASLDPKDVFIGFEITFEKAKFWIL